MSIFYKCFRYLNRGAIFALIGAISAISIISALYIDKMMGFDPCPLCIYQRIPYILALFISIMAIFLRNYHGFFLQILIFIFITGAGIAIYHTGIEKHWWQKSSICKAEVKIGEYTNLEEFKSMLDSAPIGDCSKPAIRIVSFSLAEINTIISFILIFILIRTLGTQ